MLGKPHLEQDRVEGGPAARSGAGCPSVPSGRSLDPPGNRGTRRMAAALASWAGGQNPAYRPPPAERRPETMSRVGTDSERAARVHRANGVPRPAKAGAADLPERQRITREATRGRDA